MDVYFNKVQKEAKELEEKINLKEDCLCKVPNPTSYSFGKGIFHYCKTCFKNYDKPYFKSK